MISCYFVVCIGKSHFAFANAIAAASLTFIMICVAEFSIFILVAYNMIYINHLSTRIYQSVYSLTYKTDSLFANKEVIIKFNNFYKLIFNFLCLFIKSRFIFSSLVLNAVMLALLSWTCLLSHQLMLLHWLQYH